VLLGASAVGATAAEAPLAIARDMPAAPHAGKAIFPRFFFEDRFVCAIRSPPLRVLSNDSAKTKA
jgi:hypothetical protein